MGTKYSNLDSESLAGELIVNKRRYDIVKKGLKIQKRLLTNSEKLTNNSNRDLGGRIKTNKEKVRQYSNLMEETRENLTDLYCEYLSFNRNGDIPELIINPEKPTTDFLKKYKNFSREVKNIWEKYKKIPKRPKNNGSWTKEEKDGNLRHDYIEKMKEIEKEIYMRFFIKNSS